MLVAGNETVAKSKSKSSRQRQVISVSPQPPEIKSSPTPQSGRPIPLKFERKSDVSPTPATIMARFMLESAPSTPSLGMF